MGDPSAVGGLERGVDIGRKKKVFVKDIVAPPSHFLSNGGRGGREWAVIET